MIGPLRRRKAFRMGIVLLPPSAPVSVVALSFDEPQQFTELTVAANVVAGPGPSKVLVGQGTRFTGSTRTRQTLNSGVLNEKFDSGRPERDGLAQTEINDFLLPGWISRNERSGRNCAA